MNLPSTSIKTQELSFLFDHIYPIYTATFFRSLAVQIITVFSKLPLSYFFFMARHPLVDQGIPTAKASGSLSDTETRWDSSGRVIGPSQRSLLDKTHHSQEADIHEIRTSKPCKRAPRDPRLRPRASWDHHYAIASVYLATPHCDCIDSTPNVCCMCNI